MKRLPKRILDCAVCVASVFGLFVAKASAEGEPAHGVGPDAVGRSTAVALNYCRASFHRIKRCPSKWVLLEEQEKILNNLNLNEIADEELLKLYTGVLIEINEVQIVDKERQIARDRFVQSFVRQVAVDAFVLGTDVASQQYANAICHGAKSWWDYRSMAFNRDLDLWQIDKQRMIAFVNKSSQFLDTFWKLARRRNIPDRWLVRDDDLDRLETALQEPNLQTRLRVLRRMERFMECYPPYWYYVGRTEQALGQLPEAAATFKNLAELGGGHFRKDDMLAAATANRAAIEDYLGEAGAADTAEEALTFSTNAWEANLLSAQVLKRRTRFQAAEDAILRNVDVGLERDQSIIALVMLYSESGNEQKLLEKLNDPAIIKILPAPVLFSCAARAGVDKFPRAALSSLMASLSADVDLHFGRDDLVFRAGPVWRFDLAQPTLYIFDRRCTQLPQLKLKDAHELRYDGVLEVGSPLKLASAPGTLTLALQYPGMESLRVHLQRVAPASPSLPTFDVTAAVFVSVAHRQSMTSSRNIVYRVASVDIGDLHLPLDPSTASTGTAPSPRGPVAPPTAPAQEPPPTLLPAPAPNLSREPEQAPAPTLLPQPSPVAPPAGSNETPPPNEKPGKSAPESEEGPRFEF